MNGGTLPRGGDAGNALPHHGVIPAKAGIQPVAAPPPRWSGEASGCPASAGVTLGLGAQNGPQIPPPGWVAAAGRGLFLKAARPPTRRPLPGPPSPQGGGRSTAPRRTPHPLRRHGRARPGHPTHISSCCTLGWVPGSSPGMTPRRGSALRQTPRHTGEGGTLPQARRHTGEGRYPACGRRHHRGGAERHQDGPRPPPG